MPVADLQRYNTNMSENAPGNKVAVIMRRIGGKAGYDVSVRDPEATVEDYLAALDRAILVSVLTGNANNPLPGKPTENPLLARLK
ncbi:MAG: hypothetical protein AB1402_03200 [Bacillota bacterium]